MLNSTNNDRVTDLERSLDYLQQRITQLESLLTASTTDQIVRPFKAKAKSGVSYPAYGAHILPGMFLDAKHSTTGATTDRSANGYMDIGIIDDDIMTKEGDIGYAFRLNNQWFKLPIGQRFLIAKSPSGGIPASTGTDGVNLGSATCNVYGIDTSTDQRISLGISLKVYNTTTSAIDGDTWIGIMPAYFGAWVVILEVCDE